MKNRGFIVSIAIMAIIGCLFFVGCDPDNGDPITPPDSLPENWETMTYDNWIDWLVNLIGEEKPANWQTMNVDDWENWIMTIDFESLEHSKTQEILHSILFLQKNLDSLPENFQFIILLFDIDEPYDDGSNIDDPNLTSADFIKYGIDISNWSKYHEYTGFGSERIYYRKSADSLAMALDMFGTNRPDLFLLEESTGEFPLGKWNQLKGDAYFIFTDDTITICSWSGYRDENGSLIWYWSERTLYYIMESDNFVMSSSLSNLSF